MIAASGTAGVMVTAGATLSRAGQDFSASPEGRQAVASGPLDWILLGFSVIVVIVVVVLCVKFLVRPGETAEDHIKRRVLRDEVPGDGSATALDDDGSTPPAQHPGD